MGLHTTDTFAPRPLRLVQCFFNTPRFAFMRNGALLTLKFLAIAHLAMQLLVWLPGHVARQDSLRDVPIYLNAIRAVKTGRPLYQPYSDYGPNTVPRRYFYPPPFAAALSLVPGNFSDEPTRQAFSGAWYILLLCGFWWYAWALAKLAGHRHFWGLLIAGLALGLWPGANVAMSYGNVEPLMWALLGTSLSAGWGGWRGAAVAVAALIKIHPLLALATAFRRETRAYKFSALATLAAGLALGATVCGAESYAAWRAATGNMASQGTFLGNNVSLSFACIRLVNLTVWTYSGGPLPGAARIFLMVCAVGAPLATVWFTRGAEPKMRLAILFSVTILFAPLCWDMYLPVLLLPLALCIRRFNPTETESALVREHAG